MSIQTGKHFDIIRKQNLKQIVRLLRSFGEGTKAELSEATGLSFPTVGSLINELVSKGEVILQELDSSTGGRRAERFSINPFNTLILTGYIEAGNCYFRVVDSLGKIIESVNAFGDHESALEVLLNEIDRLLSIYPTIKGISLGLPGAILDNIPFYIPDYPNLQDKDIKSILYKRTGLPVWIENDVNCMVEGYGINQLEPPLKDSVYIFLGQNGPGAGIKCEGKVIRGGAGFAGEISFIPINEGENLGQLIANQYNDNPTMVLSKVVTILSCVINPTVVIISGIGASQELCNAISSLCGLELPITRVPKCVYSEQVEGDYFAGLVKRGLEFYFEEEEFK